MLDRSMALLPLAAIAAATIYGVGFLGIAISTSARGIPLLLAPREVAIAHGILILATLSPWLAGTWLHTNGQADKAKRVVLGLLVIAILMQIFLSVFLTPSIGWLLLMIPLSHLFPGLSFYLLFVRKTKGEKKEEEEINATLREFIERSEALINEVLKVLHLREDREESPEKKDEVNSSAGPTANSVFSLADVREEASNSDLDAALRKRMACFSKLNPLVRARTNDMQRLMLESNEEDSEVLLDLTYKMTHPIRLTTTRIKIVAWLVLAVIWVGPFLSYVIPPTLGGQLRQPYEIILKGQEDVLIGEFVGFTNGQAVLLVGEDATDRKILIVPTSDIRTLQAR